MANVIYNSAKVNLLNGGVDLDTDTIKVALVSSAYTASAAHDFFDDITNEVSATGYTAGGQALASPAIALNGTTAEFDAADVTWSITGTVTARGAVVYKDTGSAATSPLLFYYDFGTDETAEDGDFTIQWSANGLATLS